MNSDNTNYVTKDGLKKLEDEIVSLKTVKMKELAERIGEAKELGDLSENAEYIEAKEEQGMVAKRIAELQQVLKNTEIIAHKKNTTSVEVGSRITVKSNLGVEHTYTIVGSSEADPNDLKISNQSPLGEAFIGKKVGDSVEVTTPGGVSQYTILSVE